MRNGWAICALALCFAASGCATNEKPSAKLGNKLTAASSTSGSHRSHGHLLHPKQNASAARDPAQRDLLLAQQELLMGHPGAQARAVALYRRAANLGNAIAEYDLGFCYESGLGVPVDLETASLWYRRAASNRSDSAVQRLAATSLESLTGTTSVATQWSRLYQPNS